VPGIHLHDLPERRLADRLMSIAESRSVASLGEACCAAVGELTGSPTVGLYLLEGDEPELAYSRHVADDFLDNYKAGFWKTDPVLDTIMTRGRAADGASVIGAHHWAGSESCQMLRHWGFSYNMGGPLVCDSRIVGVLFTATRDVHSPYTALLRERMDILCRAGSLALANMMNAGLGPARIMLGVMPPQPPIKLPPRSADVAQRVCRGQTNKEIARDMGISDQTVKEHVANLCKRFGAHNRTELVACLMSGMSRQ
jgi:DNA-binding CsgD family transcriptional regulator